MTQSDTKPHDTKIDDETEVAFPALPISAELSAQVDIAQRYPRSIRKFRQGVLQLGTLSAEIAEECSYALPRAGKTLIGPSARFAEILASQYRNVRVASRMVEDAGTFIVAESAVLDIESNVGWAVQVRRRITDKHGKRYDADMITVTANAAASIASRNAICKAIPKALWNDLWMQIRSVAVGNATTLPNRRENALKKLSHFGVTVDMVLKVLEHESVEEITIGDLEILFGMFNALKEGDSTVEELFPSAPQPAAATPTGPEKTAGASELKTKLRKPKKEPGPTATPEPAAPTWAQIVDQINAATDLDSLAEASVSVQKFPPGEQQAELVLIVREKYATLFPNAPQTTE